MSCGRAFTIRLCIKFMNCSLVLRSPHQNLKFDIQQQEEQCQLGHTQSRVHGSRQSGGSGHALVSHEVSGVLCMTVASWTPPGHQHLRWRPAHCDG